MAEDFLADKFEYGGPIYRIHWIQLMNWMRQQNRLMWENYDAGFDQKE